MPSKEAWLELLPHAMQVCTPLVQAGANYHFDSKLMDKKRDHEVELAERRAEGLKRMSAVAGDTAKEAAVAGAGGAAAGVAAGAAHEATGGRDVYDRLEQMRQETKCGFCKEVASALQNEPEERAQQGARELRQLIEKRRDLEQAGASKDAAAKEMRALSENWSVIPEVFPRIG